MLETAREADRRRSWLTTLTPVMPAAGVNDAVRGDQHLRLDLLEAVDHRGCAHVGRADAPDRTDARGGKEGDDGLGDIRKVGGDAIAGAHALCFQMEGEGRDLAAQFGPVRLSEHTVFAAADDRRLTRGLRRLDMPHHLTRVIDLRPRKPDRARHLALRQHLRLMRRRLIAGRNNPRCQVPEAVEVGDRPSPHRLVVGEMQATMIGEPTAIERDLGNERGCHRLSRHLARTSSGSDAGDHSTPIAGPARPGYLRWRSSWRRWRRPYGWKSRPPGGPKSRGRHRRASARRNTTTRPK